MFLVDCPLCRCRHLCGPGSVREIGNLAPGVLAVVLACRCGAEVTVMTGRAVHRGGQPPARDQTPARRAPEDRVS